MADPDDTRPPRDPWQRDSPAAPPLGGQDRPATLADDARPRYSVSRELARGGIGRVLEGYDHRLERPVAIKELIEQDPSRIERFTREALITARLAHPAIVPVYDVARWASGDPFYAMKLVAGRSLAEVVAATSSLAERLALLPNVIAVAEALAYAHSRGVVHRDLKPGNILVGDFGETVVIDWGLALERERGATADEIAGTPGYMSPEQAAGHAVDARADVYALGAVLDHVLSGAPPAAPPLAEREPGAPRDLVTIVEKAMARVAEARYPSARELADDLLRFQTGQLVTAHHYSTPARLARWLRRHRVTVGVAAALLAALLATALVSVGEIVAQRDRAERTANDLRLSRARAALESDPTAAIAWLATHQPTAATLVEARDLYLEARSRGVARQVHRLPVPAGTLVHAPRSGRLLVGGTDGSLGFFGGPRVAGHDGELRGSIFVDGSDVPVTAGLDGALRVWDLDAGTARLLAGHEGAAEVVPLPGRRLASVGLDGTVRVWDVDAGRGTILGRLDDAGRVAIAAAPDGETLYTAGGARLEAWRPGDGARRVLADVGAAVGQLAATADGVVAADAAGVVHVVAHDGTRRVLGEAATRIEAMALSPDGQHVAVGGIDGTVRRFAIHSGTAGAAGTLERTGSTITALAWSPDGTQLCAGSHDGLVRWWFPAAAQQRTLRGHATEILACAFAPDGHTLLSAARDGTLRVWDVTPPAATIFTADGTRVMQLVFTPDGAALAAATAPGKVWLFERGATAGRLLHTHARFPRALAIAPDSDLVASGGDDALVRLASRSGRPAQTWSGHTRAVWSLAFAPDGAALATGSLDGTARLWDVATGRVTAQLERPAAVTRVAFFPDGHTLAVGADDLTVWPLGGAPRLLPGHHESILDLVVSPDGAWVASTAADHTARLWNAASGAVQVLPHGDDARDAAFSPDSRWLATSSLDRVVRLWPVSSPDRTPRSLTAHRAEVADLAFSPDGRRLVSAGADATVRVWDLASGAHTVLRHPTPVRRASFAPDGAAVATAGEDGTVRLWTLSAVEPLATAAELRAAVRRATDAVLDADEGVASPDR